VTDPPRANGELVFEAPWESRAFGIAMALRERGVLDYERFRAALIDRLGDGEADYYCGWQDALERVLVESGVVSAGELERARAESHDSARRSNHRH
jgi:nitrile hydratase accessory protein